MEDASPIVINHDAKQNRIREQEERVKGNTLDRVEIFGKGEMSSEEVENRETTFQQSRQWSTSSRIYEDDE